ncbi:MAG: VOC family protein [Pseudonocardia sp.]|nr:VOC family protein [Pseudonocardia sp.]
MEGEVPAITPCLWFDGNAEQAADLYCSVAGGEPGPCGWLKDRFGLSWQIIPPHLLEWLDDADREAAGRVAHVMLGTHGELDLDALRKAHDD